MKKIITFIMLVMMLGCFGNAKAVNYQIQWAANTNTYGFTQAPWLEQNDNAELFPNFNFAFPDNNTGTDDQPVVATIDVTCTVTGPGTFSFTQSNNNQTVGKVGTKHNYFAAGKCTDGGVCNIKLEVTYNYTDTSKAPLKETWEGTVDLPKAEPKLQFTTTLKKNDGTQAIIAYDAKVLNYDGNDLSYFVSAYASDYSELDFVESEFNTASGQFVINNLEPGTEYDVTVYINVTNAGGEIPFAVEAEAQEIDFEDEKQIKWTQQGELPHITYEIVPTPAGSDFNYKITLGSYTEADVESVLVALLKGGEAFNDQATFHATTLEGTIPVTFEGAELGVWFKAQVTFKDNKTIQLDDWDKAFTIKKGEAEPVETVTGTIVADNFEAKMTNGGELSFTITFTGDVKDVAYVEVWGARQRVEGDKAEDDLENMNVTKFDADKIVNNELKGVLDLTMLPSQEAATQVWPKFAVYYTNGTKGDTVQGNPITCNTIGVGVETVAADNSKAEYYTLQGVKVAEPAEGQIYIVVKGGNATKVAF